MARPNKKGLQYYNIDTDRYQDIKIKRLKKDFGCNGIAVWDYVLNEIYRIEGSFTVWDENTAFDVADYFGIKENLVNEIISYCCNVGLFNKELRASGSILTSKAIQERYLKICKDAKRVDINIKKEFDLIDYCKPKKEFPREETEFLTEETKLSLEETIVNSVESTQSKVKKKKEEREEKKKIQLSPEIEEKLYFNLEHPIEEVFSEIDKNTLWKEQVCMSKNVPGTTAEIKIKNLDGYLIEFYQNLSNKQVKNKSLKDTYSHFINWLEIKLKNQ